jgi:NitT/TauT family transport system substrate-binding protein
MAIWKKSFVPFWIVVVGHLGFATAAADAQQKVRAAYIGVAGGQGPFWLAIDLGFFKKHGLDVEAIQIRGGALATSALIADEVDFVVAQGFTSIVSALQGHDVTLVGTYYNKNPYSFVTTPGISRPSDLVGKKIGLLSIGSVNSLVAELALNYWGIPESKVVLMRAGATRERVQAMMAGSLDATVAPVEELRRIREAGMTVLLDIGKIHPSLPMASITARKSSVAAKQKLVKQFLMGISEGVGVFRANKDQTLRTISKWARLNDKDALEDNYQAYHQSFSVPPKTDLQGIQLILDFLAKSQAKAKTVKAQGFVDERALQELQAEGYFANAGTSS